MTFLFQACRFLEDIRSNQSDDDLAWDTEGCLGLYQVMFLLPEGQALRPETSGTDDLAICSRQAMERYRFRFRRELPDSAGFDSILVIVDHCSKGIHLVPAKESWNAEEFAFVFFD